MAPRHKGPLENFRIGSEKMPIKLIHAIAIIKKSAAISVS